MMEVKEAVIRILKEAGKPLHASEITKLMIEAGLWESDGKALEDAVSAQLQLDIQSNGDQSPFMLVAPMTFGLRDFAVEVPDSTDSTDTAAPDRVAPNAPSANGRLSFTDCAEKVLEEFGGKRPMHYWDITEKALEMGWLITSGKTPQTSMLTLLITEIKRKRKRGERPRFVHYGHGYFGLSEWTRRGLALQIEQHNEQVRKALRERLLAMTPGEFEELISQLLLEMGFEAVEVTRLSGDGGIDVRGILVIGEVIRIKMAVQVKKWKSNIQAPIVQQVGGSLGAHEQGLIITSSDFSPGAIKEAAQPDKTPIALMNGEQLVLLLMEHDIGVHRSTHDLFEVDEEFAVKDS